MSNSPIQEALETLRGNPHNPYALFVLLSAKEKGLPPQEGYTLYQQTKKGNMLTTLCKEAAPQLTLFEEAPTHPLIQVIQNWATHPEDLSPLEEYFHDAPEEGNESWFSNLQKSSQRLSYSQLSTLKRCPRQYAYRYLYGLPEVRSEALQFGTLIHTMLERIMRLPPEARTEEQYLAVTGNIPPHLKERYLHITRGLQGDPLMHQTPLAIELPFVHQEEEFLLTGRIDRIDEQQKTLQVIDYKTGKVHKEEGIPDQLLLYGSVLTKLYPDHHITGSYFYVETGELHHHTISEPERKAGEKERGRLYTLLREGTYAPTPQSDKTCQHCSFQSICTKGREQIQ